MIFTEYFNASSVDGRKLACIIKMFYLRQNMWLCFKVNFPFETKKNRKYVTKKRKWKYINFVSIFRLQDWRCLWCRATVHTACRPAMSDRCPLGPGRLSVVPPTALHSIGNN